MRKRKTTLLSLIVVGLIAMTWVMAALQTRKVDLCCGVLNPPVTYMRSENNTSR